ncbi:hypothetical protein VitviT2T_013168 [Vitis vinifera]|uniref:Cupin type-1 domain-containing protein n=2 Tax=Vitis vinifera TaxID=29760 RepID=A0ABY9CG77_VITVI|nr:hypothetical protein VitviT2T_013168 [Vitis vinifera]
MDYDIKFSQVQSFNFHGFSDSDWAGCVDDMRSTSSYCFNFGFGVFSWSSKKQEVMAQSTTKAEYIAAVVVVNQTLWLRKLLTDLDIKQEVSTQVFEDNQATISIANDPVFHAAKDFCVADFKATQGLAGYQCKVPEEVVVDDLVYSGLNVAGNFSDIPKSAINAVFVDQLPGLNGLGLSMARLDLSLGGVIPMHSHPGGSEVLLVTQGSIIAGFISSNNIAYMKTLKKGDIMVFPKGLLHFQVKSGPVPALLWSSFSSSNPGQQVLSNALFSNNLASELIEKVTFLDELEVEKLKVLFGGSG